MNAFFSWCKHNSIAVIAILVAIFFALKTTTSPYQSLRISDSANMGMSIGSAEKMAPSSSAVDLSYEESGFTSRSLPPFPPVDPSIPPSPSANRLIITDTSLSMVVNSVSDTINQIQQIAQDQQGFLVNSDVYMPEGGSSGSIIIRVPAAQHDQTLNSIRDLGVRVVSENISGRDVTDQFENIQAQLDVLNNTKTKFEQILADAQEIQDLLEVQRELVNLQVQIDHLVGRQTYLEQSANLTKISIYLSTDELALSYTPDQVWRPQVIFKQAVRSLIQSIRSIGNTLIWLAVYSVVWIPALIIIWLTYRKINARKK